MNIKRETIEKIVKEEIVTYVACDGTEFGNEEACREYEKSAECAITSMYRKLVVSQSNEYHLFGSGTEDYRVDFLNIKDESDVKTALMYFHLKNPYENFSNKITSEDIGKIVAIGWSFEESYCWRYGSFEEYMETIKKNWNNAINEPPEKIYV